MIETRDVRCVAKLLRDGGYSYDQSKHLIAEARRRVGLTPSQPWEDPFLAGDGLVEQAEDRRGQQNDERPNHAPDHSS